MRNTWLFALLLWMFVLPMARTQDTTPVLYKSGNAFLTQCEDMTDKSSSSAFMRGACIGYVVGVIRGFGYADALAGQNPIYCIPEEATNIQLASILIKFIKNHPEKAHLETADLEIQSLMYAFPCKAAAKKK